MPGVVLEPASSSWSLLVLTIISFPLFSFLFFCYWFYLFIVLSFRSVFLSRGERIVFWRPNTNTNIIRSSENDRIRIRIIFNPQKMTEYEYKYYSVFQKWPNTNTNIIRSSKNDQIWIWIIFGPPKMTDYE